MKCLRYFAMIRRIALWLLLIMSTNSYAHSPHDVIDAIEIAPTRHGSILFAVISHKLLLRSMNGGVSWKDLVLGLDNRHEFTDLAVAADFAHSGTVFAATDGDGIYVSHDGGWSWSHASDGLPTRRIRLVSAFPGDPQTVLAMGTQGGSFWSDDAAKTWHVGKGLEAVITAMGGDHDSLWGGSLAGGLYMSGDAGRNWRDIYRFPRDAGGVSALALLPDGAILVGTEKGGVFVSHDRGEHFQPASKGITDKRIRSLLVSPKYRDDETIWVSSWGKAVFRSGDGGESWQLLDAGLTTDPQAENPLHHSPQFRDLRWGRDSGGKTALFLGGFDGLFRSTDLGGHWEQIPTLSEARVIGLGISPQRGGVGIALTTYGAGAYTLTRPEKGWDIRNYGLKNPRLTDISYSPAYNADHMLITAARGEMLVADGRNGPWVSSPLQPGWMVRIKRKLLGFLHAKGLPASWTSDLVSRQERTPPFPVKIAVSPAFRSDHTIFIATRTHGVIRYVQGQDSYTPSMKVDGLVSSLAISPDYRHDKTIFASARQQGVFKSMDGGVSWRSANQGLDFLNAWNGLSADQERSQIELARSPYFDIHLAISPTYADDETVLAGSGEGLYRSIDGGIHWSRTAFVVDGQSQILGLALSPRFSEDHTLLVSVKGAGLYKSEDGGMSFSPLGGSLIRDNQQVLHILFSPDYARDRTLFVASSEHVYRSQDDGQTWKRLDRPVRFEDQRERIRYTGSWKQQYAQRYSASTAHVAMAKASTARLRFMGTGIRWLGSRSPDLGVATVLLDNESVATVDQSSPESIGSVISFEKNDLSLGPHTIEIRVERPGKGVVLDAFDVLGGH